MVGEDLKRLAMLCHQALADVADAPANLLGGHDPQIASRKLLDEHRGTRGIAVRLELSRDRDDVAVADATDLDDLHVVSIYKDSRMRAASLLMPGCGSCALLRTRGYGATCYVWYIQPMLKTTIYLPDELHQEIKHAAKERGTSEAELIRTAVRHELLGAPADQQERAQRRARLLAAMGKLDSSAYPSGYLDELRAQWRG